MQPPGFARGLDLTPSVTFGLCFSIESLRQPAYEEYMNLPIDFSLLDVSSKSHSKAPFIRNLPKVELHRHLDCSMRWSTLLELAPTLGIELPPTEALQKEKFLVQTPMKDLQAVLSKFLTAQKLLASEQILTRLTLEAIEDAYHEGIKILELRYAPTFIQQGHPQLSFDKIHQAILRGKQMAAHLPVAVGLICIVQRILPLAEAEQVVQFAIDHKDSFVALDLADNEVGFEPSQFSPLFLKAKAAGLHITVHAGESPVPEAAKYVEDAILCLGAERIGHGLQIIHSPQTIELVKSQNIPLELCPISNWLTNAIPHPQLHPIRRLMEQGVKVTINSDDPGIFGTDLLMDYLTVEAHQNFTQVEFHQCNQWAAEASFIPLAEKQKYWNF